jgi:S-formylglutathione hydrolase FrmB
VRASHAVVDGPAGLHLLGVSMGGGGGLQMWLEDPARFASATIISAPILDEAGTRAFLKPYMAPEIMERVFGPPGSGHGADPYARLATAESLKGSRLVFGVARHDLDAIVASNVAFDARLTQSGVPHLYVQFPGFHGWAAWAPMFEFALCHQLQPRCAMRDPEGWVVSVVD